MTSGPVAEVEAVVFDLDGTLIDSAPDIAAAVNRVMADLGERGADGRLRRRLHRRRLALHAAADLRRSRSRSRRGGRWTPSWRTTCATTARRRPSERSSSRFVREDLARLHGAGTEAWGLHQQAARSHRRRFLEALGIDGLFSTVLGADAVPARKPDRDHLLAVLGGLGVQPAATLYVGDSEIDRACAHAAGVRFYPRRLGRRPLSRGWR